MPAAIIDNPILNSPFAEPSSHWELDENGIPTGIVANGRRRSEFIVPVPPPKHKVAAQASLGLEDEYGKRQANDYINEIRGKVTQWRTLGEQGLRPLTSITIRLLRHWRELGRTRPLFFCQLEAIETAIWLAEVAPRSEIDRLHTLNAEANPDLLRIAFKLATGAGKTTVMGMLIAWQTLNAREKRGSTRFTDAFLIVAPGLTVRDRLRVLLPADPANIYTALDLVPREMRDDLQRARVVITNFHAFRKRETLEAPKLAKAILAGRTGTAERPETDGQMIQRVCKELLGRKRVIVINDEAHHCYREKVDAKTKFDTEARAEAKKNNAAARLWISGIEALQCVIGQKVQVYDLSATPFFLRGSGYPEGTLFPWVVSDFSLIDAIECGVVKVPRVPVQDLPGADEPIYRHVYKHIRDELPKVGRSKQTRQLEPDELPSQLTGAMHALYGHYRRVFDNWAESGGITPPVFIVVCNNTATSKLVHDWIAGYEKTEATPDGTEHRILVPGNLSLFSNITDAGAGQRRLADRPVTVLIDSEELESGDALSDSFRKLAATEIDAFKRELRARGRHADAETITDSDLLREVMNTVGQLGRLGEPIRCVVSVSMLTEGWDARTVTHVLGVRAFGTQLLCEQVIGRALRRVSYDPVGQDEAGNAMFAPEFADVLGIPFSFVPANSKADYTPPKKITQVRAVLPEREALEIRFPRVIGYRTVLPPGRVTASFTRESRLAITPEDAPPEAINAAIVGSEQKLSLDDLRDWRDATIAFHLAGHTLRAWFRDSEDQLKPWLFPSLLAITRRWMAECLTCTGRTFPAYLLWRDIGDKAAERIYRACIESAAGASTLRAILDPYNEAGSSAHVGFGTTKTNFWTPRADKCQLNLIVCDKNWEAASSQALDEMPEVLRYVKNDHLGFEVPYVDGSTEHRYRPDFIAVIDDGHGPDDPLHLIVEMKGRQTPQDDAKHDTARTLWIPAVNALARFGRWDFVRAEGPFAVDEVIRGHLASRESNPREGEFWRPLDVDRLITEQGVGNSARYEALSQASPMTPDDAQTLRNAVATNRAWQRARRGR
jgi:type III restriction enzyme